MLHHLVPDEVAPGLAACRTSSSTSRAPRTAARCRRGSTLASSRGPGCSHEALELLRLTSRIDLDDLTETTAAACTSRRWEASGRRSRSASPGVRPAGDGLRLDPRLPKEWRALELALRFRGSRVQLRIEHDALTVCADHPDSSSRREQQEVHFGDVGRRPSRAPWALVEKGGAMNKVLAADRQQRRRAPRARGRARARRRPCRSMSRQSTSVRTESTMRTLRRWPRASRCARCAKPVLAALAEAGRAPEVVAVVLGARGVRSGRRPAGHVALELALSLPKPLVVVPPDARLRKGLRRILVPLNGRRTTAVALAETLMLASGQEIELVVLHVYDEEHDPALQRSTTARARVLGARVPAPALPVSRARSARGPDRQPR